MGAPNTVSVVVATRNRTTLLEAALRSIASQTGADVEAIVADDGSSEEVLEHHERLLKKLGTRFRLLRPKMPGAPGTGPAAARNRGASAAGGEFLAFLDDDDEWPASDYLGTAVRALTTCGADYVFGHLEGQRDGRSQNPGWVPPPSMFAGERQVLSDPPVVEVSLATLLTIGRRFMVHPIQAVVRLQTFQSVGGFFEPLWSHGEDANLMLRLFDASRRVLYLPRTVAKYRLPAADSISLTETELRHSLQRILATQQARLSCGRAEFRRCARAREAWTYREMAAHARTLQHQEDARAFARQALATYPSLGAAKFWLSTFWR